MKKTIVIILTILISGISFNSCEEKDSSPIPFVENILVYNEIPKQKLSLDVILNERIDNSELENVAKRIYRNYGGSDYAVVFIVYYQIGMQIGSGGYASSHFRPNLEIEIYGLTNKMIDTIKQSNSETNNYWIDDDWLSLATIRKVNNKFELYRIGSDLSTVTLPLNYKLNKDKDTVFYDKRDNGITFYLKNVQNQIEVSDEKGLIYKMFKQ